QRALRFALDMMRSTGGHVLVLSVLQVAQGSPDTAVAMTDHCDEYIEEVREEIARLAPDDGDLYDLRVVYGSPGEALLAQAREDNSEHIVIGHTDRGALLSWLLGSVSSDILARAPV